MSYAINNQEVANTFINYTYCETNVMKLVGGRTVYTILDFKEENFMYARVNVQWK